MKYPGRKAATRLLFTFLLLLLAACGESPQDAGVSRSALSPQVAAATAASTRQWVNGVYIETGLDSVPAQVYRLYRAAFGRTADPAGLGYQVAQVEVFGHSMEELAANFVASPEFQQRYGNQIGNETFVVLLYSNVLNRTPSADEINYYTTAMDQGRSRALVLLGFADSPENRTNTAADVTAGLTFQAYPDSRVYLTDGTFVETNPEGTAAQVYRLYQAAFARPSDPQGLGYHIGSVESLGVQLQQISQNFIDSPEFKQLYGSSPTDAQFITQLYANVLHRVPSNDEVQYYVNAIANGRTRAQLLLNFSESPENKNLTATAISAGMHFIPYPKAPTSPPVDPLAPLPAFGYGQTLALWGILEAGVGGDSGGDGGASGGAGDGAPLKNAAVVLVDAQGHTVNGFTDDNGQYLLRFNTASFVAPYVVKVVDSSGNVLASATAEQPATGTFVRINVTPLTDKITSDVLDPAIGGTDKAFTGAAIDASRLATAKQDLVTSIADALNTAGVSAATFDPVRSAYVQNGTGVDTVIESLSHTRDSVTGQTELLAKLAPVQTDDNGVPIPVVVSASTPLSTSLVATIDSSALTFAKLNNWVAGVNHCLGQTDAQDQLEPMCANADQNIILSPNFKHSSRTFEEHLRMVFSESDGSHIVGAKVRNPVVLFTGRYSGSSVDDQAVVEMTVSQPRTGPRAGNISQPLEYTTIIIFKRDDSLAGTALAGNWIAYGNQRDFIDGVATRYVKSKEMNPAKRGNTNSTFADTYQTRINLTFNQNAYNANTGTYVDSGVHAVRFTGPGLPSAGVVMVRSSSIGAANLAIHNKTGTIPPQGTTVNTTQNSFGLAAVVQDGSALASTLTWNTTSPYISSSTPDFSQLGAYAKYKMEIFLQSNTALTTPDRVEFVRNLAPTQPPSTMTTFAFNDVSPSSALATATAPSAQSIQVQWTNNLATGTVTSAQVDANERNPKGATSGYTTTNWDVNTGVYGAFTVNRPTSQVVTSPSTAFPSLTTAAGDFRQIGIWSSQSRAIVQNLLRWDN